MVANLRDRSSIKFGIIAGAAMPPELLRRIVSQPTIGCSKFTKFLNRSQNSRFQDYTPAGA